MEDKRSKRPRKRNAIAIRMPPLQRNLMRLAVAPRMMDMKPRKDELLSAL